MDNRTFAVDLMNRAGLAFDVPDVGLASGIIAALEAELGQWLAAELSGVVTVEELVAKVRDGSWKAVPNKATRAS
jgi:hypothetical protein